MSHSDIDECLEELDGCEQICTNTDGSYYCTCMDGYELGSDNHTCTGDDYTNYPSYIRNYVSRLFPIIKHVHILLLWIISDVRTYSMFIHSL